MPNYIEGIRKTGFILEHQISELLQKNKWFIINNKYYEDDLLDTVREIDIVAYKVGVVDDVYVFTTLLISCKKNEKNAWVLLSRNIDESDPNSNFWPLHVWSNDIATKDQLKVEGINKQYYEFLQKDSSVDIMRLPTSDVFAFQEMSKANGNPQNDKNIFNSITTLMKSQAYEMSSRNPMKGRKSIYQFNLISMIDSDLVQLHMIGEDINQRHIESEQVITRYIIRRKEEFFRIRFLKAEFFEKYLEGYELLHKGNLSYLKKIRQEYFKNIMKDQRKVDLLKNEFYDSIIDSLYTASSYYLDKEQARKNLLVVWDVVDEIVRIFVTKDEEITDKLNSDDTLKITTKRALKEVYKFRGDFEYSTDDLPF